MRTCNMRDLTRAQCERFQAVSKEIIVKDEAATVPLGSDSLPSSFLVLLDGIAVSYVATAEAAKRLFCRKVTL